MEALLATILTLVSAWIGIQLIVLVYSAWEE